MERNTGDPIEHVCARSIDGHHDDVADPGRGATAEPGHQPAVADLHGEVGIAAVPVDGLDRSGEADMVRIRLRSGVRNVLGA